MMNTAPGPECLRTIGELLALPLQPGATVILMLLPTSIVWPGVGFGFGEVVGGTGDVVGGTDDEVVGIDDEVVGIDEDVDDDAGEKVVEVGEEKEVTGLHLPSAPPLQETAAAALWENAK